MGVLGGWRAAVIKKKVVNKWYRHCISPRRATIGLLYG